MNKQKFITIDELKMILGITGTALDNILSFHIQSACNVICDILGVHEVMKFDILNEKIKASNSDYLLTDHTPINWAESIIIRDQSSTLISGDFFAKIVELRRIRRKINGECKTFSGTYYVDYSVGFANISDVPNDLKMLVALIVQASILKIKSKSVKNAAGCSEAEGEIKRYSLGSKTVEYFSLNETAGINSNGSVSGIGAGIDFEETANTWARKYKKFKGFS